MLQKWLLEMLKVEGGDTKTLDIVKLFVLLHLQPYWCYTHTHTLSNWYGNTREHPESFIPNSSQRASTVKTKSQTGTHSFSRHQVSLN